MKQKNNLDPDRPMKCCHGRTDTADNGISDTKIQIKLLLLLLLKIIYT